MVKMLHIFGSQLTFSQLSIIFESSHQVRLTDLKCTERFPMTVYIDLIYIMAIEVPNEYVSVKKNKNKKTRFPSLVNILTDSSLNEY